MRHVREINGVCPLHARLATKNVTGRPTAVTILGRGIATSRHRGGTTRRSAVERADEGWGSTRWWDRISGPRRRGLVGLASETAYSVSFSDMISPLSEVLAKTAKTPLLL